MFSETSFSETLSDSTWANHSHRGWSTIASFTAQAIGLAILLLLPFVSSSTLPTLLLRPPTSVSAAFSAPVQPAPLQSGSHHAGLTLSHTWTVPSSDPGPVTVRLAIQDPSSGSPPNGDVIGVNIRGNEILNAIGNEFNSIVPPPPPVPKPIRVSRMMEGNLIYRVDPIYPVLARMAHVQGTVVLQAVISKAGTIERLETVSGHPLLISSAMNAVRQWRYRPFFLNDEAVEVDTQITVNFTLSQ